MKATTFELLDAKTYTANLHAANAPGGSLEWKLEYSFVSMFGMKDMSPASFEQLHAEFAGTTDVSKWDKYKGTSVRVDNTCSNEIKPYFLEVFVRV